MPSLLELQTWLRRVWVDPRGAEAALESDARWLACIESSKILSAEARLSIYAEAYFARILEAMEGDFPAVRRVVGEQNFQALVLSYLTRHPSRSPNIGEVGREFKDDLARSELLEDLPFLSELASLEWAIIEAFHADEASEMDSASFASLDDPALWPGVCLVIDPSLRRVSSRYPVDEIWRARDREDEELDLELNPGHREILIWRSGTRIRVEAIASDWGPLLRGLKLGAPLSEVLENSDLGPEQTQEAFFWLIREGLIRGVRHEHDRKPPQI